VVPHAARFLAGRRHRALVPASFLLGAAFLLAAHTLGKALGGAWFLPVGVYTSLVVAPAFLVLLLRRQRRVWA
jgi:iron complex transport system permease protein